MKGGFLYQLDKKGEVGKIKHEQAELLDFSLSHNVMSGPEVIGARGCKECHSKKSPFFLRKVLIDPYDEKGRPVYIENWERLGIDKEKLSRLLMDQ
jgi:formate-dependent nitrite reductase cytochrome c552 subunit